METCIYHTDNILVSYRLNEIHFRPSRTPKSANADSINSADLQESKPNCKVDCVYRLNFATFEARECVLYHILCNVRIRAKDIEHVF